LRPDVVANVRAAVSADLDAARLLRLRRDQWILRQALYQDYQRSVGSQLLGLVKAQPQLEAIRRLDGPPLDTLQSLMSRLSGGAERLQRLAIAEDLRPTHSMLVGAWRFAENAANGRADAVSSGNVARAWEASSAAAANAKVVPVGEAWNRAMEAGLADTNPYDGIDKGKFNLWTYDSYHASTHGYYLEALTVFGSVTGRDPRSLGENECSGYELGLSREEVKQLQQVAFDQLAAAGTVKADPLVLPKRVSPDRCVAR
jgi:hypothetical protein